MNPERWRQIDEMFRAVSEAEPERRAALLAELAAGDEGLRREVEALLEASEEAGGFLESDAFGAAAPLLAGPAHELRPGQPFGRYRVVKQIGAGGMGEVYLAEDTLLGRPVALKLLSASFTSDPERIARFKREAQAVSHLNHPHIVTVYEVGEADGLRFLATEYVEGETLRDLLGRGRLPLERALDVAAQVASALAAAHEAGVVHRDIKPENVMLRPDGYVKVLDFGLAKLTERPGAGGEQPTLIRPLTQSGVVMGTAHYISPEQARGLKVYARTDVWSLGCVLYEMLAGRPPFDGETPSDVLVSILSKEPAPLSESAPHVPEEARRVVSKALSKEKEGRYASMREMLEDLREARDEATFRARQELHLSAGGGAVRAARGGAPLGPGKRRRGRVALWVAVAAVAASALAFGIYRSIEGARTTPPSPPPPKMSRVTANGKISLVALSPDGKHAAYVAGTAGAPWPTLTTAA